MAAKKKPQDYTLKQFLKLSESEQSKIAEALFRDDERLEKTNQEANILESLFEKYSPQIERVLNTSPRCKIHLRLSPNHKDGLFVDYIELSTEAEDELFSKATDKFIKIKDKFFNECKKKIPNISNKRLNEIWISNLRYF